MAICYARVSFAHLLPDSGACRILAYNSRCEISDRRLGKTFDYSDQAADLVEQFVIAPDGVEAPETVEAFANAVDAAEAQHVRRSLKNRKRRPQVGALIVAALPGATECTLDENLEIARRLAERVRDGRNLLLHLALHDPALLVPGARTRHAHVLVPLREWQGDRFGGPKLRELFARVRQSARPKARKSFVAEGADWPKLAWAVQQALFAEWGTDLVVDPIAPHSEPHWNPRVYRAEEARVRDRRAQVHALNLEAIRGDPADLLESLMRGRSSLRVAELERFIARFIDADDDRRARLDAILGHDAIVGMAPEPGGAARLVTTCTVRDRMIQAASLVDRAADKTDASRIRAVTAADHDGVVTAIHDLLRRYPLDSRRRKQRPLIVGLRRSDTEPTARATGFARPTIATIGEVLEPRRSRRKGGPRLPMGGIVVVPRAEQVEDQLLARLLSACHAEHIRVVLGHDQSRQSGVVANRLAADAAENRAAIPAPARPEFPDLAETARLLRAGLIGPAVKAMAPMLTFATTDAAETETSEADFVVCDDPRRLCEMNERLADTRPDGSSIEVKTRRAKFTLREGEWIAFTQTDYAVRPPRIRAGRLAQIVSIDRTPSGIHVSLPYGKRERIDLEGFPHVRPAHAISIREALLISWPCTLRVEITSPEHAWAALLLACGGTRWPSVVVDPKVARDAAELAAVVRTNLPGALPNELSIASRPDAIDALSTSATSDRAAVFDFEIERIPESVPIVPEVSVGKGVSTSAAGAVDKPSSTGPSQEDRAPEQTREIIHTRTERLTQLAGLDERARDRIASSADAFAGFVQLRKHLAVDNPERQATAAHLLSLCDADGPTAAVIALLMGRGHDSGANAETMHDFPTEMETRAPRTWPEWDLFRLKMDLKTMRLPSRWGIARPPDTGLQETPAWVPPHP